MISRRNFQERSFYRNKRERIVLPGLQEIPETCRRSVYTQKKIKLGRQAARYDPLAHTRRLRRPLAKYPRSSPRAPSSTISCGSAATSKCERWFRPRMLMNTDSIKDDVLMNCVDEISDEHF